MNIKKDIEAVTKYSNYYLGKCYTWLSTPITMVAAKLNWHPNLLTSISLLIAIAGCISLSNGSRGFIIVGVCFLYLSYVFDWCDGQLARYTKKVSPFGGWFDQISDRLKEFLYILSFAIGAYRSTHQVNVYIAAMLAIFLLFLLEYYGQMARAIPEPQQKQQETGSSNEESSENASLYAVKPVTKRFIIDFGIDEQYAYAVVAPILFGERWTLYGLVLLSGLMAVYKPVRGWQRYLSAKRGGLL